METDWKENLPGDWSLMVTYGATGQATFLKGGGEKEMRKKREKNVRQVSQLNWLLSCHRQTSDLFLFSLTSIHPH